MYRTAFRGIFEHRSIFYISKYDFSSIPFKKLQKIMAYFELCTSLLGGYSGSTFIFNILSVELLAYEDKITHNSPIHLIGDNYDLESYITQWPNI